MERATPYFASAPEGEERTMLIARSRRRTPLPPATDRQRFGVDDYIAPIQAPWAPHRPSPLRQQVAPRGAFASAASGRAQCIVRTARRHPVAENLRDKKHGRAKIGYQNAVALHGQTMRLMLRKEALLFAAATGSPAVAEQARHELTQVHLSLADAQARTQAAYLATMAQTDTSPRVAPNDEDDDALPELLEDAGDASDDEQGWDDDEWQTRLSGEFDDPFADQDDDPITEVEQISAERLAALGLGGSR